MKGPQDVCCLPGATSAAAQSEGADQPYSAFVDIIGQYALQSVQQSVWKRLQLLWWGRQTSAAESMHRVCLSCSHMLQQPISALSFIKKFDVMNFRVTSHCTEGALACGIL